MNNKYLEENDILYNNFLENYYYKKFREETNTLELEIIVSPHCNLGCKYCYLHKFYKTTFPDSIYDEDIVLSNMDKVLNWIEHNKFKINLDIFSGELFAQEIGYKLLDKILKWNLTVDKEYRLMSIVIPTNFTFILSEEHTKRVQNYIDDFKESGTDVFLSSSFDGKLIEDNRPYYRDLDIVFDHNRDDEYYDKVFKFSKKNNSGFHPMVYSKHIEKWKDNFMWFQNMFEKYGIDWEHLYLLQVRNVEWSEKQINDFYDFIYFLCEWSFEKCDKDVNKFIKFLFDDKGFNILAQPLTTTSKGLTCAIQTELTIRLADMKSFPCHRLLYENFEIGEFIDDDKDVLKFKTSNASLGITTHAVNKNIFPKCITCPINELCTGGCLGSQYEVNGSMYVPIDSVCNVNFALIKSIISFMKHNQLMSSLYRNINIEKKYQIKKLEEML